MKKNLLGILGSPRKHGNSELLVKELYRNMPGEWQLKLLRLPELHIEPCRACYKCLFGEMICPQRDDFPLALSSLVEADAYVVAAPTYFLGANSSLKRFLDRGLSLYAHLDKLWGKPAVGISIAGIGGMEGYTKLSVDSFIKLTMGDLRGSVVVYGALPGEVFLDDDGKAKAAELAQRLLYGKDAVDRSVPVCPVCEGDTFRFLGDGKVRCMLCSSEGQYEWSGDCLQIHTSPGDHPLFNSYESAQRHAEWLQGMKEKFMARRKELKVIAQEYTKEGTWIHPVKSDE